MNTIHRNTFLLNLGTRTLAAVAQFAAIALLAKRYSLEALGTYNLIQIYAEYVRVLIGLTFYVYVMREMSKCERDEWPELLLQQLYLHVATGTVLIPITSVLFLTEALPPWTAPVFYVILLLTLLNGQTENYLVGAGLNAFANVSVLLRRSWVYIILAMPTIIQPTSGALASVLWMWAGTETIACITSCAILRTQGLLPHRLTAPRPKWIFAGVKTGIHYTLISATLQVSLTANRVLLGVYYGPESVGEVYLAYGLASAIPGLLETSIINEQLPRLLTLGATHSRRELNTRFKSLLLTTGALSATGLSAIYLLHPWLARTLKGNESLKDNSVVALAAGAAFCYGLYRVTHYYLYASARDGTVLVASSLAAVVSTGLSVALIPSGGVHGAAVSLAGGNAALLATHSIGVAIAARRSGHSQSSDAR